MLSYGMAQYVCARCSDKRKLGGIIGVCVSSVGIHGVARNGVMAVWRMWRDIGVCGNKPWRAARTIKRGVCGGGVMYVASRSNTSGR